MIGPYWNFLLWQLNDVVDHFHDEVIVVVVSLYFELDFTVLDIVVLHHIEVVSRLYFRNPAPAHTLAFLHKILLVLERQIVLPQKRVQFFDYLRLVFYFL